MKKSTHRVEVVRLNPEKHPNADSLVIQKVYGYTVVLRAEDWKDVELGAYLVPDSIVDTQRPEFSWLAPPVLGETLDPSTGKPVILVPGNPNFHNAIDNEPSNTRFHKVTAMRLRGVVSYGLMVKAPEGSKPGDDVSDLLGVTRYQPNIVEGAIEGPQGFFAEYDLEAYERYAMEIFKPGEEVLVFEKLDGVNSRYHFDKEMYVGSKSIWLEKNEESAWFKNLVKNPSIEKLCRENPTFTEYGEIIGFPKTHKTKKRYGIKPGEVDSYLFDILDGDKFLSWEIANKVAEEYKLKTAPLVTKLSFDFEKLMTLADGPSLVPGAGHNREGIVIRPVVERQELAGRAVLKLVSSKSLMG